jgi:hypothetical protein
MLRLFCTGRVTMVRSSIHDIYWPTKIVVEELHTDLDPDQDELTLIIKAHLYIERILVQIIEDELKIPDELRANDLRFPTKVGLATAMGLIPQEMRAALFHMNFMRNKIAHDLRYRIDQAETSRLFEFFPENFRRMACERAQKMGHHYTEHTMPFHEVLKIILMYLDWVRHRHDERRKKLKDIKNKRQKPDAVSTEKKATEK